MPPLLALLRGLLLLLLPLLLRRLLLLLLRRRRRRGSDARLPLCRVEALDDALRVSLGGAGAIEGRNGLAVGCKRGPQGLPLRRRRRRRRRRRSSGGGVLGPEERRPPPGEEERDAFASAAAAFSSSSLSSPRGLARGGLPRREEQAHVAHGGRGRPGEAEPGGEVGDGGRGRGRGGGRRAAVVAAEKDEPLSSSLCRRRLLLLLLSSRRRRRSPLHGQSVQPPPAAIAQGPAVGLRGHGEAALGLEEGEQLEPERLRRREGVFFSFSNVSERSLKTTMMKEEKTQPPLCLSFSLSTLTCAPARSPLRSACSAPNSSERRRSPLAARTAAEEDDEEGECIGCGEGASTCISSSLLSASAA